MAKDIIFNGKKTNIPGAYSRIRSGIKNPIIDLDFGGLTIIDDGTLSSGFSGGGAVAGTLDSLKKAIYTFDDIDVFKTFIGGGYWHLLANALWFPFGVGNGINGISYIEYIRAAATVPAEMTFNPIGGGGNGGTSTIQVRDEGLRGNGIEGDEILAEVIFTVTVAGANDDTISFRSDEGSGLISRGLYTVQVGDTTIDVASGLTAAINTAGFPSGYSATNNGAVVTVKVPLGSGVVVYPVDLVLVGAVVGVIPGSFGKIVQVDTHTLTGTGGTANLNVNGVDYLITFNTSLTQTAIDFQATHEAALLVAGVVVTENTGDIILTANVAGIPFLSIAPVNVTVDLAGTLVLTTLNGAGANGTVGTKLTQGYSYQMESGEDDISKFILSFFRGTFTGLHSDGIPFNSISVEDSDPELILQSIEFNTMPEIIEWMENDFNFNEFFKLKDFTVVGAGVVDIGDLATFSSNNLASGGTETYSNIHFDTALDLVKETKTAFIIAGQSGSNAQSINNIKLEQFASEDALHPKQLYIGGGLDVSEFDSISIAATAFYNNQFVTITHSGVFRPKVGGGQRALDALYHAALQLGREAGLEPQVPLTFKGLDVDGMIHELTEKEKKKAINKGLLITAFDSDFTAFVVVRGFNSLQANDNLLNENGTTPSKQLLRIIMQINKEVPINAKKTLLANPNGVNRNTLTDADYKANIETFLSTKIAFPTEDNLLIKFQNVQVVTEGTTKRATYELVPNFEIEFLLSEGTIIDPNS